MHGVYDNRIYVKREPNALNDVPARNVCAQETIRVFEKRTRQVRTTNEVDYRG